MILETSQAFYIPGIYSVVSYHNSTVRNTSPDPICVNLSNVESDSSGYFVRILTLVIFGEFCLRRFEECRFSGIVQAENENVEVVLLRPGLIQPREQRVHIAACTSFVIRPGIKFLVPAYALPLVLRSHGARHSNVGVKVGQDRGRLGVGAFDVTSPVATISILFFHKQKQLTKSPPKPDRLESRNLQKRCWRSPKGSY